jgi:hypothetical protein
MFLLADGLLSSFSFVFVDRNVFLKILINILLLFVNEFLLFVRLLVLLFPPVLYLLLGSLSSSKEKEEDFRISSIEINLMRNSMIGLDIKEQKINIVKQRHFFINILNS